MSYLTDKFKGQYRILCPIDAATNDFPKKLNGTYEDTDLYIDCQHGNKVFHYGHSTLQAYIPSIGRGRNIIKTINELDIPIDNIEETDEEILFLFNYKSADKIIPLLKPKISAADRSPYSSKNRPKSDYKLPDEATEQFKEITQNAANILDIVHKTNAFINTLGTRKYPLDKIKNDLKLSGMKPKEFIHSIGKWNQYIAYLKA